LQRALFCLLSLNFFGWLKRSPLFLPISPPLPFAEPIEAPTFVEFHSPPYRSDSHHQLCETVPPPVLSSLDVPPESHIRLSSPNFNLEVETASPSFSFQPLFSETGQCGDVRSCQLFLLFAETFFHPAVRVSHLWAATLSCSTPENFTPLLDYATCSIQVCLIFLTRRYHLGLADHTITLLTLSPNETVKPQSSLPLFLATWVISQPFVLALSLRVPSQRSS